MLISLKLSPDTIVNVSRVPVQCHFIKVKITIFYLKHLEMFIHNKIHTSKKKTEMMNGIPLKD